MSVVYFLAGLLMECFSSLWLSLFLPQLFLQPLPQGSQGRNTGVGCHALFQGIFQTQELNPRLLHCIFYRMGSLAVK